MNDLNYYALAEIAGWAFGGALASFTYGQPIRPRSRMFGTAFSSTFTGTVFGALLVFFLPTYVEVLRWIAAILSLFARWYVPAIVERIPGAIGAAFSRFLPVTKNRGD